MVGVIIVVVPVMVRISPGIPVIGTVVPGAVIRRIIPGVIPGIPIPRTVVPGIRTPVPRAVVGAIVGPVIPGTVAPAPVVVPGVVPGRLVVDGHRGAAVFVELEGCGFSLGNVKGVVLPAVQEDLRTLGLRYQGVRFGGGSLRRDAGGFGRRIVDSVPELLGGGGGVLPGGPAGPEGCGQGKTEYNVGLFIV